MILAIFSLLFATALSATVKGPCHYDGRLYQAGEVIVIAKCLASMRCVGGDNYDDVKQLSGICPDEKREVDGQSGCLFDGKVYGKGKKIMIAPCLAEMTCNGNNVYSYPKSLGGICPDEKREVDGQNGCLFDGKVYGKGGKIMIAPCLAELTCNGNNVYSYPKSLGGVCPQRREADGQTGCDYDGTVYSKDDVIYVKGCLAKFTCLGNNLISEPIQLWGQC